MGGPSLSLLKGLGHKTSISDPSLGQAQRGHSKMFIELMEIMSFKALSLQMGKLRFRGPKPW